MLEVMGEDIFLQMSTNSNTSVPSLPQKLARLEARMAGVSPSAELRDTSSAHQLSDLPRHQLSTAIEGGDAQTGGGATSSDSDEEGADDFSIKPNPMRRKILSDESQDEVLQKKVVSTKQEPPESKSRKRKGRVAGGPSGRITRASRAKEQSNSSSSPLRNHIGPHANEAEVSAPHSNKHTIDHFFKAEENVVANLLEMRKVSQSEAACQKELILLQSRLDDFKKQWETERRSKDVEVEAANTKVAAVEVKLAAAEQEARGYKEASEKLEKELAEVQQWHEQKQQERMKVMSDLLVAAARGERQEARLRLRQDSIRLGNVGLMRAGTVLSEVWEDGMAFKDTQSRLAAVMEQKDRIEKLRKQLKRKQTADKGESASRGDGEDIAGMAATGALGDEELLVMEECYKSRLLALKREEESTIRDRERYELEKGAHIRELKRIRDEDSSRFNHFGILNRRYALLNLLGKGGFSEVYKAFDLVEGEYVACKLHQLQASWVEAKKQSYIRHAVREYNIHKRLSHPHIVPLRDLFEIDTNTFCTVLQYCPGKDLDALLKVTPILSEREARCIAVQVFQGLAYLSAPPHSVIHYDLKPGNILFDEVGDVKITDFGLSKIVEEGAAGGSQGMELTSQGAGTYWYLPPECFDVNKTPLISSKVDVWSMGIILYQMLFGRRPFGHEQTQERILREDTIIKARAVSFPTRPVVSPEAKEFIRKCLTYDQKQRPDVLTASQDPYLSFTKKKS